MSGKGKNRVRIAGGAHRGQQLAVPPGARPTEGRVREALFSIWQEPLAGGARLLDLFSGSGVVAIEGVGRGALRAVAIEGSRRGFSTIQSNRDRLGEHLVEIRRLSIPRDLGTLLPTEAESFDLVYADPPYDFPSYADLLAAAAPFLARHGELVIEHSARKTLPAEHGGLLRVDERRYGETALSFYRPAPAGAGA